MPIEFLIEILPCSIQWKYNYFILFTKWQFRKRATKTYYLTKKKNHENEYCSISKRHSHKNQFKFSHLKRNFQEKKKLKFPNHKCINVNYYQRPKNIFIFTTVKYQTCYGCDIKRAKRIILFQFRRSTRTNT